MEAFEFLRNRQLLSPDQSLHETAMPNYTWGDLIQLLDDYLKANSSHLEPPVMQNYTDTWQLCPKCNGQGIVSKPPYIAGDQQTWSSSSAVHTCDVCNGNKIIKRLKEEDRERIRELSERLNKGRDYLMTVKPSELTVEDCLEAFGYNRDGLEGEKNEGRYGKLRKEHIKLGMTIYYHRANQVMKGIVVELTDIGFKVESSFLGKKEIRFLGYASDYYDNELGLWQDLSDDLYNSLKYAEKRIDELKKLNY